MSGVLFRDAIIVTMDDQQRIVKGNLLVEAARIMGAGLENRPAEQVIDSHGYPWRGSSHEYGF